MSVNTFDAKADTPSTSVAAADKFVFGNVGANGFDTITAAKLLQALALVTDNLPAVKLALGIGSGGGGPVKIENGVTQCIGGGWDETAVLCTNDEGKVVPRYVGYGLDNLAPGEHQHGINEVQLLQAALDAKAGAVHTHDAGDLTTGTLGLARGGTGGSDGPTARASLGLAVISRGFDVPTPADGLVLWVEAKARFAGTLNGLYGLAVDSGSVGLTVKINATNVTGLVSLAVSSTPQDAIATAANTWAVGDSIRLEFSSATSPVNFRATMQATR